MTKDWQDEIRVKLDAIGDGVHCQQAQLLAEYAAQIVKQQLPDRKQRLAWMVAEAKRRYFNLEFTIDSDRVSYKWKQRRIRLTIVKDVDEAKALTMPTKYEFHPLSGILPLMTALELAALAKDIKANGLELPIVLYEGKILDGRNRYLACLKEGIEVRFSVYEGSEPLQHALSLNIHRRNLTTSQKAAVAADLANIHREDTLKQNASVRSEIELRGSAQLNPTDARKQATARISQSEAAEILGVSRTSVQEAVDLKRTDGLLFEMVKAGKIGLRQALRRAHPQKYKRQAALRSAMKSAGVPAKALELHTEAELREPTLEDAAREVSEQRQKMREMFPEIAPKKLDEIMLKSIDAAIGAEKNLESEAPKTSNGDSDKADCTDSPQGDETTVPQTDEERMVSDFKHFIGELARRYNKPRVEVKECLTRYLSSNSGWLRESTTESI